MSLAGIGMILADVGVVCVSVAAFRFKRASDDLVRYLLESHEQLLTDLCLRTQGEEQEHYRQLRASVQTMLKNMRRPHDH